MFQAVDSAGFISPALSIALTNQLPAQPAAPNSLTVDGQSIDIDWVDNTKTDSTLAISEYRIYNDTKTSLLWKGAVSLAKVSLPHSYTGVVNYKYYMLTIIMVMNVQRQDLSPIPLQHLMNQPFH